MPFILHRWFAFRPSKPRSPLLRVAVGLIGLSLLLLLVSFGVVIGLGMLLFAAARRLLRNSSSAARGAGPVLEGEYSLVDKHGVRLSLR